MRVRGRCPSCGTDRLLPGRDTDGTPICRDCAGIVRDFFCDRCGFEGLLLGGRLCEHCTLADTLAHLLDDGTGRVAPAFLPLVKTLLEMDRPSEYATPQHASPPVPRADPERPRPQIRGAPPPVRRCDRISAKND
ncbi:hypothetical protein SBD_5791 [Streptomyces bottropensis ATCC 25435]|uniref:Uncharacterized protein n=1 Tax=Streptomyces bottropensis ATCC 25435 TaxID=1054862 RepID=M3FII4_9ACTN|nr:hypothetical protein SBD_5791 [Streptomyces bottropensis ATCC 25435]